METVTPAHSGCVALGMALSTPGLRNSEPMLFQWLTCFCEANLWKWNSPVAQMIKRLRTMRETRVQSLGQEDPLEKEMATHSSILSWKIPWTDDPGRLQSIGSQRVRHD